MAWSTMEAPAFEHGIPAMKRSGSQVETQMSRLHETTERLMKASEALSQRLSAVCRSEPAMVKRAEPEEALVPLAGGIREAVSRQQAALERLEGILGTLEL